MKIKKEVLLLTITLLVFSEMSYAQFPCPPDTPVCDGQPGVPIDNGLLMLLVAAAIFGAYKIYNKQSETIKKPL